MTFSHCEETQKSISNRFYRFEERKVLDGGGAGRWVVLYNKKRLSAIQEAATNDSIVIFGSKDQECSGEVYNITQMKIYRNFDAFTDLESPGTRSTYGLSRNRLRLWTQGQTLVAVAADPCSSLSVNLARNSQSTKDSLSLLQPVPPFIHGSKYYVKRLV